MQTLILSVKNNSRAFCSASYLSKHLVSVSSQCQPDIKHPFLNNFAQKWRYLVQKAVVHIIVPCADKNPILWLQYEIVRNIVDNNCFFNVPTQQTQVFYQKWTVLRSVLSVEPVFYVLFHIYLVNYLVSVFLQCGCKNHNFIVFGHCFNKLNASWSN